MSFLLADIVQNDRTVSEVSTVAAAVVQQQFEYLITLKIKY